jgi:putative tryptophan/tyrosine transport system substrate-binding protein
MRRRSFIAGLAIAAALPSWRARAQTAVPTIGVLASASAEDYAPMFDALRKGLAQGGYMEGQNVTLAFSFADEHYDRLPALAARLVQDRVSLILAATTPAALAAKPTTSTIPIVFAIGGDPERTGLVASLGRPGGNLTGAAHVNVETAPKRLELMRELLPSARTLGLLVNPTNPLVVSVIEGVKAAAAALGVELQILRASDDEELDKALAELTATKLAGLVIGTDPFFTARSKKLAAASLSASIPSIYQYREFSTAGGVMSYGGSITDSYYKAGLYAARVLKGEKPGDLPVQLSTKVELFFNLKSARQMGLNVPLSLLGRADEVIE